MRMVRYYRCSRDSDDEPTKLGTCPRYPTIHTRPKSKPSPPIPAISSIANTDTLHEATPPNYNRPLLPAQTSSAAAPPMASLPVSLTLVWKTTLFPSFHISVTSVWPGLTVPAKRTLILRKGPKRS